MNLARVIGEVVSTVKDANLVGTTLLVLQPIAASGEDAGRTLVALDSVGAGVGETVFFVRGREAAFPFYPAEPPTDASIVGIVDHWDLWKASGVTTSGRDHANLPRRRDSGRDAEEP
jgi:microcompartment protein CcmK/EutM